MSLVRPRHSKFATRYFGMPISEADIGVRSERTCNSPSLQPSTSSPTSCVLVLRRGGLEALTEFFEQLPPSPGVPFVVVLHLSPDFKSLMPELLSKHTDMPVQAAQDAASLAKDRVYIIPPGNNMVLADGRLRLHPQDRTPGHALNLPVDLFFESAAQNFAHRVIAIILSGTGSDGSRGLRSVTRWPGSARCASAGTVPRSVRSAPRHPRWPKV